MFEQKKPEKNQKSSKNLKVAGNYPKGPSINDVSSEGEGGGPPSKPIYYISLFSKLSQKRGGRGVINSERWADVVYG